MALTRLPTAVHLQRIIRPGMQKFAALTRKLCQKNINKIDKCLKKCFKKFRTIYNTFLTLAIQRGAGVTRDMEKEFVDVMLPNENETKESKTSKEYFLVGERGN